MKNPFESKKVVFVENSEESINANRVRDHLEIVGDSEYQTKMYEKNVKRGQDIVLTFIGLVVLSPILLFVSVVIYIDAVFFTKRIGKNKLLFILHEFITMKIPTPHDVSILFICWTIRNTFFLIISF